MSEQLLNSINEVSDSIDELINNLLPDPGICNDTVISMSDKIIDITRPTREGGEAKVLEAMRYSALSGGKRLRPFLLVSSARLFGVRILSSLHAASALEFIHTYSLIHDDLPAMDDDDLRRGQPSCHIKFGEAAAILAGDGLLTLAFEILSDEEVHPDPSVRCKLIKSFARAAGYQGMVGGQMFDLESEHKDMSVEDILRLQRLKTGELFAVACEAGAILGKAPNNLRKLLHAYAYDIGLAFQITDDLLDAEGTREETGKEIGKDDDSGKATLVSKMGVEEARERANILVEQAINYLDPFEKKADDLRNLAKYIVQRKK